MREPIIFFIYENKGHVLVLREKDAKFDHEDMIQNGYEHVATIDAVEWVRHNYLKLKNQKDEK